MNVGIVGHEAAKFTPQTELAARKLIIELLLPDDVVLVSGRSPLGGIDVWAEECADAMGRPKIIHPPASNDWAKGFKPRNLLIARDCDICHVIVVRVLPITYQGRRFSSCYHCLKTDHVKSGGCWTAMRSKQGIWHII